MDKLTAKPLRALAGLAIDKSECTPLLLGLPWLADLAVAQPWGFLLAARDLDDIDVAMPGAWLRNPPKWVWPFHAAAQALVRLWGGRSEGLERLFGNPPGPFRVAGMAAWLRNVGLAQWRTPDRRLRCLAGVRHLVATQARPRPCTLGSGKCSPSQPKRTKLPSAAPFGGHGAPTP